MLGEWRITKWPRCEFHVFLSHCAEDRERIILPVMEQLAERGIIAWIDRHHYPLGTGGHEALREGLLKCRHIVYFITRAALKQGRGWMSVERAYGSLIQSQFVNPGCELSHIELPLIFVPPDDTCYLRSIWRSVHDKGKSVKKGSKVQTRVTWAVTQIERFLVQEQVRASHLVESLENDPDYQARFVAEPNILRRIALLDPPGILPKPRIP